MENASKKRMMCNIAMLAAAIIWGSSFVVVKNAVDSFPPHFLLAIRFTTGFVILGIIFHKKFKLMDKKYLLAGAVIGASLFIGYSFQTMGITYTTPGKNAFLTAVYCVIVPFLFWLTSKVRPDRYNVIAALLCIAGVGFVALTGDFSINTGDALTLVGGVAYAVQIVFTFIFAKDRDPILMTILQFGFAAALSWIVGACSETFPTQINTDAALSMAYLAICATTIAILLQNIGIKGTSASSSAIIISLEAVFGVIFSVIFYKEALTPRLIIGFVLIFAAVIISETKLSFLKKKRSGTADM